MNKKRSLLVLLFFAMLGTASLLGYFAVQHLSPAPFIPYSTSVEFDIFSGMPNPSWTLSSDETMKMVATLGELESFAPMEEVVQFPGLGYRGLVVTMVGANVDAPAQQYRVYGGIVEALGDSSDFYVDEDRAFESALLQTGKGKLDEGLYQEAMKDFVGG